MKIYLVGCSGSGKTRLKEMIAQTWGLKPLPSAARTVLKEYGYAEDGFGELMANRERYKMWQTDVGKKQVQLEDEAGDFYVSDRAFDHFAFSCLYGGWNPKLMESTANYYDRFQLPETRVFLCCPTAGCHEAASKAGDRKEYLVWEDMHRFDGMLRLLMAQNGVEYVPITTDFYPDRVRIVSGVLGKPAPKPEAGPVFDILLTSKNAAMAQSEGYVLTGKAGYVVGGTFWYEKDVFDLIKDWADKEDYKVDLNYCIKKSWITDTCPLPLRGFTPAQTLYAIRRYVAKQKPVEGEACVTG